MNEATITEDQSVGSTFARSIRQPIGRMWWE